MKLHIKKQLAVIFALALSTVALTACDPTQAEVDHIKDKGRVVQECKDSGGQWYNSPGWGESCNFDTREPTP